MGLKTIRMEIISSSLETCSEIDPSTLSFKMGPGGDLMFGIWINNLNLSATPRLFDVNLVQ